MQIKVPQRHSCYDTKIDYPLSGTASFVAAADVDGDGIPDLALNNSTANTITILRNRQNASTPFIQVAFCTNDNASFTSNVPGTSYQWQLNSASGFANISNNANYSGATTATLQLASIPAVWVGQEYRCVVNGTSFSNTFKLVSSSITTPSVSISSSVATACTGINVTFTAVPVNGGSNPSYQWKLNGSNVGTNSNTYQNSALTNGSKITCVLTSSMACANPSTATSNEITMAVMPSVTTAVSIAGNTTVNSGQATLITATPVNGGSGASYQWQDSTAGHSWQNISGNSSATINYSPVASGDKLRSIMTSSVSCASPATVTSNVISFVVNTVTAVNPVPADRYGIHLYPNPATGIVYIDTLRTADRWESLEIISVDGKQKLFSMAINNRSRVSFDVSGLSGGVYFALLRKKISWRNRLHPIY